VVVCLERGADCLHMVQLMPLPSQTPSSLVPFKSRLVLPFWYRLTQVVLEKRPLNGTCVYSLCSVTVIVKITITGCISNSRRRIQRHRQRSNLRDVGRHVNTHSCCCTDGLAITVHDGNVAYMMNWHLMKQHSRISHDVNRRTRSRSAASFTLRLLHTSAVELAFKNVALKKPFKTSKAQFRSFRFLFLLCNLINKPHIQI